MINSFYLVNYHNETRIAFDEVMTIAVESGKKLSEDVDGLKLSHQYYVITAKHITSYFDTRNWFISFKN